jgi:transcriptional regulator NrdR family protein
MIPKKGKEQDRGLRCTKCDGDVLRVVYTRAAWGGKIVRRRECVRCKERFTTWERPIGMR